MRLPTRQELALTYWGDGIAIIKTKERSNQYVMEKAEPTMNGFIISEFGLFKVESHTLYRHNKQPMSIYNSHGTTLPKIIVQNVEKFYRKREFLKLKDELNKVYPDIITRRTYDTIWQIMDAIVDKTQHYAIDLNTEKYLAFFRAFNPKAARYLNIISNDAKKGVDSLSPPTIAKLISFGMWFFLAIVFFAIISNGPAWIRDIQDWIRG